jgi:hypothetical protein
MARKAQALPPGCPETPLRYSRMGLRTLMRATYKGQTLGWAAPHLAKEAGVAASTLLQWWEGSKAPSPEQWKRIVAACVREWMRGRNQYDAAMKAHAGSSNDPLTVGTGQV